MSTDWRDSRDSQTYSVIGAGMEVHSTLGHGFLEPVYQAALAQEFILRDLPFRKGNPIPIFYKGLQLGVPYRADFVCFDSMIVELKALPAIGGVEVAQVLHYLKATRFEKALILNFGVSRLQYKRIVLSSSDLRKSDLSADEDL